MAEDNTTAAGEQPAAETAEVLDAAAEVVEHDISTLVAERDEYRTHALRLQADFENYRKRADKQLTDEVDRQTGRLVGELLAVLDTCEAAAIHHPESIEPVWSSLYGSLRKQGLEAMDALGHPFDPTDHEAVVHEPGDGGQPVVIEVLRTGYRWKGRVLRAAMVKVKGVAVAPQREWFEKDYYAVLGVPSTATAKEVTKAYRKLARQYHPDANAGDAAAEERFKEISAAYDVLGDETKRPEYDEVRTRGPGAGGFGGAPGPGGQSATFDAGDIGDLFGNLFGRRRRGEPRGAGPQRGQDLEAELSLSFLDAATGVTTTLSVVSDATCSTCGGNGSRPGTQPRVCPTCSGRGVIDDNQGLFSFSQPCTTCQGAGRIIDTPCLTCHGQGIERRPREVKVRIPGGVDDGQRIRLKGRGGPGRNGGPAGDLFVVCHVQPHPYFGRRGPDLLLQVPVTFAEAALGAEVRVPTLDGPVTLRLAPGTSSGSTQRVKGRGITTTKTAGDLLVTFQVAVPDQLSKQERKAIEELAKASTASPREHLGV